MSGQIFISYRREDSEWSAGRLGDCLSVHFGREKIFMDVDTIEPGVDFVEAIEQAVGACDVLIAVIGNRWLTSADAQGRRRLDIPEDSVRIEIGTALKRGIRVIPVRAEGALMPQSDDLPDDLKKLVRRNALQLSHDRFRADSERLIGTIERVLEKADAERKQGEEKERLEAEQREKERLEAEQREKERLGAEQRQREEKERLDAEQREREEKEWLEEERRKREEKKRLEAAITDYTEAIRLNPNDAYAYFRRGYTYGKLKQDDKAVHDYTKAIQLKPDYADAYHNRGYAYGKLKQYDKAVDDYTKAIQLKPDGAGAYFNRGSAYGKLKQYDKAVDDYTKAIQLKPDYADAYFRRGYAYGELKQYDKAVDDYTKAIQLKPELAWNGRE
jgi:tetratricopeptide (TPR) repeat protein